MGTATAKPVTSVSTPFPFGPPPADHPLTPSLREGNCFKVNGSSHPPWLPPSHTSSFRVVLINYVSDPGASDYTAIIAVGGGNSGQPAATPASVRVKYLLASTVSEKYNITWYGCSDPVVASVPC